MGYSDENKISITNTTLEELIFQKIRGSESGSISFAAFMDLCLYHPQYGYYSCPSRRAIGRGGDFFTSVSVGDTFGFLISHAIEEKWKEDHESVENFTLIEQGAHDGQLAMDIVSSLESRCPEFFEKGGRYLIVEPREAVRDQLRERFEATGLDPRINLVDSFSAARSGQGIFLANELLDAFPVYRIQFEGGQWRELRVTEWNDGFAWQPTGISAETRLAMEVSRLGDEFPDGYITEICLEMVDWLRDAATVFSKKGSFWIFDYGFEEADYFAPHRTTGTLQCYRNHEQSENPFEGIGETDLTTHVNFSHLAREAANYGLEKYSLTDQHHFLTEAATPWFHRIDGNLPDKETAQRIRQFQTLTHPSMMGRSFKVASLEMA